MILIVFNEWFVLLFMVMTDVFLAPCASSYVNIDRRMTGINGKPLEQL